MWAAGAAREAISNSTFTSPAGVGATIADQLDDTALWRKFADGATLVLQALHRTWEPVADLSTALSGELGHPVQANAYITPPQNRGFDDHYDVQDVFVLQIEGTKRWVLHEPVQPDPLRDQPWTDRRSAVAEAAKSGTRDPHALTQVVRRTVGRWVNTSYRRRPMIVPLVIEA